MEGERLSEARSEYQKLQESLSGADERENAAAEELEKARNTESEKRSAFDSADAAVRSQRGSADFGTEAEADAALDAAIRKEDESSKVFAEAEKAGTKAQENVTRALSLLKKYEEEIPQDGADTDQKQKEYKALLREKDLTEPEWMDLVSGHDRGEIETLRKETKKYGEDMSAAKARLEAAEKLTAGREKPDMNALGAGMTKRHWKVYWPTGRGGRRLPGITAASTGSISFSPAMSPDRGWILRRTCRDIIWNGSWMQPIRVLTR